MTPEELERLHAAATPAPWRYAGDSPEGRMPCSYLASETKLADVYSQQLRDYAAQVANTELIAALRNHTEQLIELWRAAKNLEAKLAEVDSSESIKAVFFSAHIHGVDYTGPQYKDDLQAVRSALAALEGR